MINPALRSMRFTRGRRLICLGVLLAAVGGTFAQPAGDLEKMVQLVAARQLTEARTLCAQLIEREPAESGHRYNLACIEALSGFPTLALDSLERAALLGFKESQLLQEDEDLSTVRQSPRFPAVAQRVRKNAESAPAPMSASVVAARPPSTPPAPPAAVAPTLPVATGLSAHGPVGLQFMTRFWAMTGSLEQVLWYFSADGRVYREPGADFSRSALDKQAGEKGAYSLAGGQLAISWDDGTKTSSAFEPDRSGTGFGWDGAIFTPVKEPADWAAVSGYFEGGASFSTGRASGTSVSALTLLADGSFVWSRSGAVTSVSTESGVYAGSIGAPTQGTWKGAGYLLTLIGPDGRQADFVSFPLMDRRDHAKVAMLFFNGSMHLRKDPPRR